MDALPLQNPTRRLGAPRNWDHGSDGLCHTLEIQDHNGWMISAWKPTEAELKRLNEGHCIHLHIQGSAHPVVALTVSVPPDHEDAL